MRQQKRPAPVLHAIAVTLPVLPPVVKTQCGLCLVVDQYRDQRTEDPARSTCQACLHVIAHRE
jgi:hypothetical protein